MLRAPVILHKVIARGSSLSAGSPFKSLDGSGGTPAQILRGELAAGGVYVLAAARAQRRREAELPGVPRGTSWPPLSRWRRSPCPSS